MPPRLRRHSQRSRRRRQAVERVRHATAPSRSLYVARSKPYKRIDAAFSARRASSRYRSRLVLVTDAAGAASAGRDAADLFRAKVALPGECSDRVTHPPSPSTMRGRCLCPPEPLRRLLPARCRCARCRHARRVPRPVAASTSSPVATVGVSLARGLIRPPGPTAIEQGGRGWWSPSFQPRLRSPT